ncbi:PAS domain S-box protein [uncultured Desulfosarcina sp.]|uniref:hybrid sensor histidine kinase/response regulator n=1 Tax=uncultured Desulfosarcina sp. TaxID=218289 RepID=UPI0029C815A1|nr:PAS domain S-box protein [uncultured Desulfosarcina sp.]
MTSDKSPPFQPPDTGSVSLADANCIVLRIDARGRVLSLNPFGLDFFGYGEAEILGKPAVGTIIPKKDTAGNDLETMIDHLLRSPEDYSHQINENRRKDGDRVWVVWSNRAFRDETGKVTEILCVGNDITDRKAFESVLEETRLRLTATIQEQNTRLQEANERLEKEVAERKKIQQALEESRDRYRQLSKASTEGILFHDNGILIEFNDAFADLVECPRKELIGMDIIRHFVSTDDQEQVQRKLASDDDQIYEITARSATGRTFPAELRSRSGELAGRPYRVVTVRDITHRKKTERQLIQSQKMEAVGTLAGGIAHDFNNMLAGIQGNVEIIRHQLSPQSPHQKRLSIISQILQRGAKLSGQLLGYARGGQTELCEINLNRLVEDTLEMFGQAHHQITIETRLSPDTPSVSGDRTQIEQVLLNLIINAVHAMPTGGQLAIETHVTVLSAKEKREYEIIPGRYAMLSVRDTGHGMDQETQKQIFEPFFTTKAQGQGTGLGLASTYGIVKNHKGYIEVFSEPGLGSQFNVLLPMSDRADKTAGLVDAMTGKGSETIMIVDDEQDFLDMGRDMLVLLGYTVITAGNSQEAIARFQEQAGKVKLVIVDMIMPGPAVDDTIRRIKEIDPSVPVLLSSGYSQDGEGARKLMLRCNGFIQKPFRLASLSKKVRELLGSAQNENP